VEVAARPPGPSRLELALAYLLAGTCVGAPIVGLAVVVVLYFTSWAE
jgi:hypothetical protein